MKMRYTMLGLAVLAIELMTAGEASARGGRCGGRFFGGHCGGQVVSYGYCAPVYYQPCQTYQYQPVQWGQPTYPQYGPAPLPSSNHIPAGQKTPLRIEEIPPAPKKGPAPLPSKETSSVQPTPTYYLINGVYYLANN